MDPRNLFSLCQQVCIMYELCIVEQSIVFTLKISWSIDTHSRLETIQEACR